MVAKITILEPHVNLDRIASRLSPVEEEPEEVEPEVETRSRFRVIAGLAAIAGMALAGYHIARRRNGVRIGLEDVVTEAPAEEEA